MEWVDGGEKWNSMTGMSATFLSVLWDCFASQISPGSDSENVPSDGILQIVVTIHKY